MEMTPMANRGVECSLCGHAAARHFSLAHTVVWKCAAADCGLQFADPQLEEKDLARAYTDLYYPSKENGREIRCENTPASVFRPAIASP
jgi:DNA-directed RNA polymerase subunit RPC12/RpoP